MEARRLDRKLYHLVEHVALNLRAVSSSPTKSVRLKIKVFLKGLGKGLGQK